jgi:hypothetical protein
VDYEEASDLLAGSGPCTERTRLSDPSDHEQYLALGDSIDDKSLAANICWGVAGGLAVTAVVLFFVEGRGGSSPEKARIGAAPTGLWLQLRY